MDIKDYTIVDTETSGLSPYNDDIIEIAALRVRDGKIVNEFSKLVKVPYALSDKVKKITGITDEMLSSDGENLTEALKCFTDFISTDIMVGHNVVFDKGFINESYIKCFGKKFPNQTFDTLELCREAYPGVSHKLEDMVTALKLESNTHHRALADCFHTYNLIAAIENKTELSIIIEPRKKGKPRVHSEKTKALKELHEFLIEVTNCGSLSEDAVIYLNDWLAENEGLAGNYPYDIIYEAVQKVLEDGIIEQSELDTLSEIFKKQINPVENNSSSDTKIDICGKTVCITGEFENYSRAECIKRLEEKGATYLKDVTKKIELLIVGGLGSNNWACGNYGTKVKKAIELQNKGAKIMIVRETEVDL